MNEKNLDMFELSDDDLDMVTGGAYVNASMSIGEIVQLNSRLIGMLSEVGIPCTGKNLMGLSLYEAAEKIGADPYALEDRMNDYLSNM